MRSPSLFILTLGLIITTLAVHTSAECRVDVRQTARSAGEGGRWTTGSFGFQIYDLEVTNAGDQPVDGAQLNIVVGDAEDQLIYQFWNLERTEATSATFVVPTPFGPIQVGATQGAGYILRYPRSDDAAAPDAPAVTVVSATCNGQIQTPAPSSPPTASSTPAPTVVATPQPPSGCSAEVSLVARTSPDGSWKGAGGSYQIYDIRTTNTGVRPINGGTFTFALPEGVTISQFWELNKHTGVDNRFHIAFNYGPLQPGEWQGSGFVGRSVSGATPATSPSVTLSDLACV